MAARTRLSLRTELAQRLGFSSSGSGAILQAALLNSALNSAQDQLFYEFGDLLTHVVDDSLDTVAGQSLYSPPANCDLYKPLTVSLDRGGSGRFYEMQIGIGVSEHNIDPVINDRIPVRWDILDDSGTAKIELWPTPDDVSNIKLEYNATLGAFDSDSDLSSINPQLILLHSIVTMKAHYRQPDWQIYDGQLTRLLGRLKSIGLMGGGSTRRYSKKTSAFFLSPSNDFEISSNVTRVLQDIISKTYVTAVDDGSGTDYIVTS
tara:strand:+ start:271 stop:1056 length:786 start_codon:yes stop_codon:yes gene_type:complete